MKITSHYLFLLRYGLVGVCGGVIQTTTLYMWVDILHLETFYLVGAVVGFCLALITTFTLQKYWTFVDHAREHIQRQFFSYTLIALGNLGLTLFGLHVSRIAFEASGIAFFHVWYLVAQITIIVILSALSFLANYFITFSRGRSTE